MADKLFLYFYMLLFGIRNLRYGRREKAANDSTNYYYTYQHTICKITRREVRALDFSGIKP